MFKDSHQGGELFLRGSGEAPVHERVVGILLKHIPGDQAAGIDKVRFKVRMFSDFFIIEGWRREDVEIFQAATLEQFGNGTFQRHAEIGMRAERGETGAVSRVKQHDADNRIFAAERTVISENRETFGLQLIDRFDYARIARHHLRRDLRQADAFGDNAVFNMPFEHF